MNILEQLLKSKSFSFSNYNIIQQNDHDFKSFL